MCAPGRRRKKQGRPVFSFAALSLSSFLSPFLAGPIGANVQPQVRRTVAWKAKREKRLPLCRPHLDPRHSLGLSPCALCFIPPHSSFPFPSTQGIDMSPIGINIEPTALNIVPQGLSVEPVRAERREERGRAGARPSPGSWRGGGEKSSLLSPFSLTPRPPLSGRALTTQHRSTSCTSRPRSATPRKR